MKIAIVTPWFGRELIGGAERHAWELAHALAAAGVDVDVLTTCCRSFHDDWATNFHRAGETRIGERLRQLRFRVDSRDRVAYGRVTAALTSLPQITLRGDYVPLDERDARVFVGESINSRALHAYVREHADDFDAVLFMPYLYGTTLSILPQIAAKAFLIPCLHDEAYAYLDPVRSTFARARGILFNSPGEEETAAAIYGPGIYAKSRVVGEAVEPVSPPRSAVRIGGFAPNRSRYVLYLGRQVATKNIDFLIAAYELFRERRAATSLQLVLAGPTNLSRRDDGIVDLGPVNEEVKSALLLYARALAQPSLHESFSRSVYEAWFARRPVFVHGRCRATARAVEDSGGGWIGSTLDDWAQMFAELDESSDDAVDAVGERGWAAARDSGTWDVVAQRVLAAIRTNLCSSGLHIDQAVPLHHRPAAEFADALNAALNYSGNDAETFVFGGADARPDSHVIAHVVGQDESIAADVYIVHEPEALLPASERSAFATTRDVAARLDERGISSRLLPLPVSVEHWDGVRPVHERWSDGLPVLLSIAPLHVADAKRLLDVFVSYLGFVGAARLLVFKADCDEDAESEIERERVELDLTNEVEIVGHDRAERYTAYRAATAALAVGQPICTAAAIMPLWFEIPILSISASTPVDMTETAGLIDDLFVSRRFAALLRLMTTDEALRAAMRVESRRVRERHAPGTIVTSILEALDARPTRESTVADAT